MVDIQFMHTSLPVISCTGIPPTKGHWFFFKLRSENVVWLVTQPRDDSAFLLGDIQNVPRICEEWNPGVHWDLYFGFDLLKHTVYRINFWAILLQKQGKTYQSSHLREREISSVYLRHTPSLLFYFVPIWTCHSYLISARASQPIEINLLLQTVSHILFTYSFFIKIIGFR